MAIKTQPFGQNIADAINGMRLDETKVNAAYEHAQKESGNPHKVTKADVGLSKVDNTSDMEKPISTAMQEALNLKSNKADTELIGTSTTSPIIDSANGNIRSFEAYGKCEQKSLSGNQLLELHDRVQTTYGVKATVSDSVITISGIPSAATVYSTIIPSAYKYMIEPNKQYTLSGAKDSNVRIRLREFDEELNALVSHTTDKSITFTTLENAKYYDFFVISTLPIGDYVEFDLYPMLNSGSNALPWEEYCGGIPSPNPSFPQQIKAWDGNITTRNSDGTLQSVANLGISLYGIKVASGGNYTDSDGQQWLCDKVDLGKGVIERYCGKKVFNGTEDWAYGSSRFRSNISDMEAFSLRTEGFTNLYSFASSGTPSNGYFLGNTSGVAQIFVYDNRYTSADDFKAFLSTNNLKAIYKKATPTTEPLTDSQLMALRQLQTFSDGTFVEYGGLEPFYEMGYWLDTKNGQVLAELDAKVNQIFALLINPQVADAPAPQNLEEDDENAEN